MKANPFRNRYPEWMPATRIRTHDIGVSHDPQSASTVPQLRPMKRKGEREKKKNNRKRRKEIGIKGEGKDE